MKICIHDSNNGKFSNVLRFHWMAQGHEVLYAPLWDPRLCDQADVIFIDWADQSIARMSDPEDQFYTEYQCKYPIEKNIILRAHDIDIWCAGLDHIRPNFVKHLVFVSDHTFEQAKKQNDILQGAKVHIIPHGIDTEKYTLRKQQRGSKKIGWVGRYDHNKLPELALMVLAELPRDYTLYLCGRRSQPAWQEAYWTDYINKNQLSVVFQSDILDMNEWWEDKDYCLSSSQKEAFGYSIAEAMAKGVKPIIHRFYGANGVWPEEWIWDKITQARDMILSDDYKPEQYRKYIQDRYPIDRFFAAYDELLVT